LNGVRGLAVLAVLALHAEFPVSGGYLGVDIFFVLSGFLITTLLLQEWATSGWISLRAFFIRRALRLFPALAAVLAAFAVVSFGLYAFGSQGPGELQKSLTSIGYGAGYVANVVRGFGGTDPIADPLGHLWSLAAEEQFYLFWPVTLLACLALRARPRTLVWVLVGAICLVAAHRVQLLLGGPPVRRLIFGPDTHADPILVGCLAGVAYTSGLVPAAVRSPRIRPYLCAIATLIVWTMVMIGPPPFILFTVGLPLFELATATVILCLLLEPSLLVGRLLSWRPVVSVGRVSYGLYLWHPIVFLLIPVAGVAPTLALTFLVAYGSYRFIEAPFLRRKRRYSEVQPAPGLGPKAAQTASA
jgi:peptidoglycan/LPS O-acetylase OafA/YrhL